MRGICIRTLRGMIFLTKILWFQCIIAGCEIRSKFLAVKCLPVQFFKPRMHFNLIPSPGSQSVARLLLKQPDNQIPGQRINRTIEPHLFLYNIPVNLLSLLHIEGRESNKHLINDAAEGPPVHCLSMSLPQNNLRGDVLRRSTHGLRHVSLRNILLRQSEIRDFRIPIAVYHYVFRLQTR